jgi:glycosyltransferase involved in cell wall biosynthesis
MEWHVVSPYFETADDQWISHAVADDRHRFTLIPRLGADRNWHQSTARAGVGEWLNRFRQAARAFAEPGAGVITVFPQLAAAAGGWKLVRRDDRPLVSWMFNTEAINAGVNRWAARPMLEQVDRFVVHSRAEVAHYANVLRMPAERFEYVPLQYGAAVETERPEGQTEPYVFATGTGYRDYETFFAAMNKLGYRTLVLASERALAGLTIPPSVEILDQISRPEIRRFVRHARVNVVPLRDGAVTAGLVTIVETFRHGRSLVVTDRPGLEDYCIEGETALFAGLFDAGSMAEAIDHMWSDADARRQLDAGATAFAEANCTDEVAARHLVRILDSVSP